jgi:hypothetical protein
MGQAGTTFATANQGATARTMAVVAGLLKDRSWTACLS